MINTGLTGTELDVIIGPKGGHGKDGIDELGGFFVMTNTNLKVKHQTLVTSIQQMILDEYQLLSTNSGGSATATAAGC